MHVQLLDTHGVKRDFDRDDSTVLGKFKKLPAGSKAVVKGSHKKHFLAELRGVTDCGALLVYIEGEIHQGLDSGALQKVGHDSRDPR